MNRYPWHEGVISALAARSDNGSLPAAIGLSCPLGWGGRSLLARAVTMLLGVDGDKDPEDIAHPDLRWIAPDGVLIKIDQVRALNAFAVQTPQIAGRKVAGIYNAHLLNNNAANTLLKTLEEPPGNTHILLSTPYWSRLLPTIRSRCQRFQVNPSQADAQQWLSDQGVAFSPQKYVEAGYAPIAYLEHSESLGINELLQEVSRAQHFSPIVEQVLAAEVPQLLAAWYRLLIHRQSEHPSRALLAFADELSDARRMIEMSSAANSRLILERLFHLWQQVEALQRRQQQSA